ncbi:MAG: hypothetical protein F4Z28_08345 [Gammaproteobacteria bacterium]|nr:hypothetical protein [Gammaproteobacteria bacterium]
MAARKPFLLRTEPEVIAALQRWAADELRSVNAQIDFLLRRALRDAGRMPDQHRRDSRSNESSVGNDPAAPVEPGGS